MSGPPLIQGPVQVLGWTAFSVAVLAVPVAALLGQLSPPLPHLARLPNLPLQTLEGRLIDSHAFLGEVLIVELAPESSDIKPLPAARPLPSTALSWARLSTEGSARVMPA